MISSKIKELNATKAKIAKLESEITRDLHQTLSKLHTEFGFDDVPSFIKAVKAASTTVVRRGAHIVASSTKRTRAKINAGTHAAVKKMVKAGETGAAIAAELGISLPSVQNIKKTLGLTRTRKSKKPGQASQKKTRNGSGKTRSRRAPAPSSAPSAVPAPPPGT
jgi:hypothetical protein